MKRIFYRLVCLCFAATIFAQDAVLADEDASIAVLEKLDLTKATDTELFEASSACRNLTRIGTEKSVSALEKLLDDGRTRDYARTALRNIGGEKAEAVLKRHPAKKDNASPIDEKLTELRPKIEQIYFGGEKGLDVFSTLLKSEDEAEFHAALQGFRRCPTRSIVDRLAKEQASLKPECRVAAILSILDRKDAAPLPAEIFETAKSDENADVQAAAIAVLGAFPDDEKIRFLFQATKGKNDNAAFEALATTTYPKIETLIAEYLKTTDVNLRMTTCALAGERAVKSVEPELWTVSREPWFGVQVATFSALGRIVDKTGFEKLLDDYASENFEKVRSYILIGIKTACQISADRPAYAKLIAGKISDPVKKLELLAELGGEDALKSIAEIAKTTDKDEVRDQATKILGEWTGAEVAPVLLDLSESLTEPKYKVRTLRGFLRAVRQFEMSKEEKRKLCEKALGVAVRDEEKKMIRDVLGRL